MKDIKVILFFIIFLFLFSVNSFSSTVDKLQVDEAQKSMEKAFSEYANYISLNSANDEYAGRLYHNYLSLKKKYENLKAVFDASQYKASNMAAEYFFSPHEESMLRNKDEISQAENKGPQYDIDYRLGWITYINGEYNMSLELFELAIKKSEKDGEEFFLPYLGLARVYTFLAEKDKEKEFEYYSSAKKNLKIFTEKYSFSDDIKDMKRKYLVSELKSRLNYIESESDIKFGNQ